MKAAVPYMCFNGNCRDGMNFYKNCFGGDLQLMTYADAPEGACPEGSQPDKSKIMHGFLKNGDFALMAADMPADKKAQGNNMHIYVECNSKEELEKLFKTLGDGGKVTLPLADTFWGAHFGMLMDKFEVNWMLSYMLKK